MLIYKEDFLRFIWDYVKGGARLKDVMETVDCNKEEAINIYDQASSLFGRGPRIEKKVQRKIHRVKQIQKPRERPAAEYSAGYLHTLSKYNETNG